MDFLNAALASAKRKSDTTDNAKSKYLKRSEKERLATQTPEASTSSQDQDKKKKAAPSFFANPLARSQDTRSDETSDVTSPPDSKPSTETIPLASDDAKITTTNTKESTPSTETTQDVPVLQVKSQLRLLGEPVTLFGESNTARLIRLKKTQLAHTEAKLERGRGQRNIYQEFEREAGEQADNENGVDPRAAALEEHRANKYKEDKTRADFDCAEKYILFVLKRWLYLWETELAQRPAEQAASVLGKQELMKCKETRQNLLPLFKDLKARQAIPEVAEHLERLLILAQQREFVQAHEEFMSLAVGKAAWPIGVTMVGIHERAGRERISVDQISHIMNDERVRKYVTAVKRILSYMQEKLPTNPSKMFK